MNWRHFLEPVLKSSILVWIGFPVLRYLLWEREGWLRSQKILYTDLFVQVGFDNCTNNNTFFPFWSNSFLHIYPVLDLFCAFFLLISFWNSSPSLFDLFHCLFDLQEINPNYKRGKMYCGISEQSTRGLF